MRSLTQSKWGHWNYVSGLFLRRFSPRRASIDLQGFRTLCSLEFQAGISWREVVRSRGKTKLPRVLRMTSKVKPWDWGLWNGIRMWVDGLQEKTGRMVMEWLRGAPCDVLLVTQPASSGPQESHALLGEIGFLEEDRAGQSSVGSSDQKATGRQTQE